MFRTFPFTRNGYWLQSTLLALFMALLLPNARAQKAGNEWISYGQTYVKLLVWEDGVYRVRANATGLSALLGSDPTRLQLYLRGQQVPIYLVNRGNPTTWDGDDYFEFYGERNTGADDAELFKNLSTGLPEPQSQTNDRVSLFTDTAAYFLTVGSQPGLRYSVNTDADYNNLTPRTHYTHTYWLNYSNCSDPRCDQVYRFANGGIYDVNTQLNSDYVATEGYAGVLNTAITNLNLPVSDLYAVGNLTYSLNVRMLAARSIARHDWELQVGPRRQIFTFSPQVGIGTTMLNMSGPASELTEGFTPFSTTPLNTGFGLSHYRYSYIELKYPRQFRFANAQTAMMEVSAPALTRSLLQLQNFGHTAGDSVFLFDITNAVRVRASLTGSTAQAILPKGSGSVQRVYATTGSQIREPLVQPTRLAGFNNTALGAEFLIITHDKFLNSANAYALYRDTNTVNPLRTRVVTVQELYDEFGYGNPTPLALKRAVHLALRTWQLKPKFLMLWGKGSFARRNNNFNYVPTWNAPATDYEFVSNFDPTRRELVPEIGVGRLNIQSDDQGLLYLEKINIYEHTPYEEWMKQAVHLGGGAELNEQIIIKQFLENARNTYEGPPNLGKVFSQFKVGNNVIDQSDDTDVRRAIDNGVNILTFFGHSTSNIFDVNLKDAYFYNNWNKFPFVLANGCYSGDFASNSTTFGERFMFESSRDAQGRLRGGIGFLSSTTTGFLTTMGVYTEIFYKVAFRDSIGRPISNIIAETKRRMAAHSGQSQSTINHIKQINLQCDPSLRIYSPTRPDLWVDNRSIVPRTGQVTTSAESLVVRVGINNRGLQLDTTSAFNVKLTLTGPNLSLSAPLQRLTGLLFPGRVDSLTFVFQPGTQTLAGLLTLRLEVDPDGEVAEISESNNVAELAFVLPGTLPSILYPTDFAVINREQPSLQAALIGQTLGETTFEFEIDSSWRFDSPLYYTQGRSGPLTGPAYQVSWPLPFALNPGTVYYWRVRRVGGNQGGPSEWITASFQYRPGTRTGWAQARPPQFFDLQTNGVSVEVSTERWQFGTQRKIVEASINVLEPSKITLINPPSLEEGRTFPLSTGGLNGILYSVIDGINLRPQTYNPNLGHLDILNTSGGAVNNLPAVVQSMREGDYLVAMGVGNPNVPLWRDATFDALNQVGVSNAIRQLASGNRFVVLGRKGQQPGSAIELLSANLPNNQWLIQENIYGPTHRGTARTRTIGPAKQWEDMTWDFSRSEASLNDEATVTVYGVRENGTEVRLFTAREPRAYDLRSYSATTYPYLRLEAVLKDSLLRTAPQLENWYVYYQPVPDAALDPNANLVIQPQVVEEGRNLQVGFTVRNLTPYGMDSLLVHYLVSSSTQPQRLWLARKVAPLPGDGMLYVEQLLNTDGLAGDCKLTIHINPGNAQPELNQFNNLLSATFEVLPDRMNPVLDVTFDGRHIRNLELVRPSPIIDIMAYDENEIYLLDDTSKVEVYLKGARDFSPAQRIFYNSGQLSFTPATAQNPRARVRYTPGPLRDSTYQLEVQVVDRRGNRSGMVPYRIQFQVESQASLSNVLAVPNPFSDFTRFSYRLTGTDIPARFLLEIYHPSGRLVRTIDLAQLGEVYIGEYITQFAWDGTDQNGNRLDNGVYSYRITASLPNGQALPVKNAVTGEYFPNGWGKVAILR